MEARAVAGVTSIREARAAYFARAGFAADGGYGDCWVRLQARGRTVFAFPNTATGDVSFTWL
jgi:hypothetical protein